MIGQREVEIVTEEEVRKARRQGRCTVRKLRAKEQCCGSVPLSNGFGSDPDPAIFVSNLQVSTKNNFFRLLKLHKR
jgi:hypothetical protein